MSPEVLAAISAIVSAICSGSVALIGGAAAAFVLLRRSGADARRAGAEAKAAEVEVRRGEVAVKQEEMSMLRGELARLDSHNDKLFQQIGRLEKEREDLHRENAVTGAARAELERQLEDCREDCREEAEEQSKRTAEAEELVKFLANYNMLLRKALIAAGVAVPPLQRKEDEAFAQRLEEGAGIAVSVRGEDERPTRPGQATGS